MKKVCLACVCFFLFISLNCEDKKNNSFSIGIDLVSLGYDQVLIYFEKPVNNSLSLDVALGYSPGGLWNKSFKYWYVQTHIKSYLLNEERKGLYTGFGLAAYFSDTLLSFSNWHIDLDYDSSIVLGVLGTVGWKHYLKGSKGLYFDPNIFVYSLSPIPAVLTKSKEEATFQYNSFSLLSNAVIGFSY